MNSRTIVAEELSLRPPEVKASAPLFERTVDAFAWRFTSESSKFALQVAVMIVLARLLPVESFGLLTLCLIVINFASRAQLAVSSALVQREKVTALHIRVAFSLSALSGIVLTFLIWTGAPLASTIFRADITHVLRLISFSFLFTSCGAIAEALLERKLDYRRLMRVELCAYGIGYCAVGITLALFNYGVWSLAWATLVYSALRTILLFWTSPHTMRPSFSTSESAALLNFSTGMTLSRLANFAAANADYFVVGRWLGTVALGLYSRAFQLMSLPMYQFSSVIGYVLFPAYAQIQNDTSRLKRAYLGSVALSFLVILPALTGLAITAPDLIAGCFGAQWTGAILPLQILCIGGVFQCMYNLGDSLSRAKGAVYWKFWCHFVYALCVLVGSYIGSHWGITGVAVGVVVAMSVIYILMAQLSIYLTSTTWKEFFLSQLPGAIVAGSVAGISLPTTLLLRTTQLPHLGILSISLVLSILVAVTAASLLPRTWLQRVSHGSIAKASQYYWRLSQLIEPLGFVKTRLRQHETAFKIALVPYRFYENVHYLLYTVREGLWKRIIGSQRRALAREKRQATMIWNISTSNREGSTDLIGWFRENGVDIKEGGHTFYIPPQQVLDRLIPSVISFYPPNSGFKILRDVRPPDQARYFYKHRRSLVVLGMLIGTPQDQVITANYLYWLGIGPRVLDLTCWASGETRYTVFVVEHVGNQLPTPDQYEYTIGQLKKIDSGSHLRILIPGWERNDDFMPPNCNRNLVFSQAHERSLYVDFQNFGMTSVFGWRKEIASMDHGQSGENGKPDGLRSQSSSTTASNNRGPGKDWDSILRTLDQNGVSLKGRIVLDLDCQGGGLILESLKAGANWCFGWVEAGAVAHTTAKLLSEGATRFTLFSTAVNREWSEDVPQVFQAQLSEAIIFGHTATANGDILTSLPIIPWRALVLAESQCASLDQTQNGTESVFRSSIQSVILPASFSEDYGSVSPFTLFLRA